MKETNEQRKKRHRLYMREYSKRKRLTDPLWIERVRERSRNFMRHYSRLPEIKAKHIEYMKEYKKKNPKKYKKQKRDYYLRSKSKYEELTQNRKTSCIFYYSGGTMKCSCCGENNYRFLTLDHIMNDGNYKRKNKTHPRGGASFYKWLIDNNYVEKLQVLCWNCNEGKRLNGGICPHINKTGEIP